jgi:hypothetical protein
MTCRCIPGRYPDPYSVVWVDVPRFDAAWKAHEGQSELYIAPRPTPRSWNRGWYSMPEVWFDGAALSFQNGRHRFAWVRDHGGKRIPVAVRAEQAGPLRQALGALRSYTKRQPAATPSSATAGPWRAHETREQQ